uniref:Uncharacterized protein n=1 Tax=Oryza punctata TaxID=4537 RepID=A0A0E0MHU3_ORYPU
MDQVEKVKKGPHTHFMVASTSVEKMEDGNLLENLALGIRLVNS